MDNASHRGSSLQFLQPMVVTLPIPDGSVDDEDRHHTAHAYSGILAAAPVTPPAPIVTGGRARPLRAPERPAPKLVSLILSRVLGRAVVSTPSLVVVQSLEPGAVVTGAVGAAGVNVTAALHASAAVMGSVAVIHQADAVSRHFVRQLERAREDRDELAILGL